MKKMLCVLLAVLMLLSMVGCTKKVDPEQMPGYSRTETSGEAEESTEIPEESADESKADESADVLSGPFNAQEIYYLYEESVVKIDTGVGGGSGFYIEEDVVCTNFHVIEDAQSLSLYTPSRIYGKAIEVLEVIGWDQEHDVALLRVDTPCSRPIPIRETVPFYGEPIFSIGAPVGIFPYISEGIVTKVEHFGDHGTNEILTNMDVFGGMSGSAAMDQNGEVIGIVSGGMTFGSNNDMTVIVKAFYIEQIDRSDPIDLDSFIRRDEIAREPVDMTEAEIGNVVHFGRYEQDNDPETQDEAIEWIVLDKRDDGALMLMSYFCLDAGAYSAYEGQEVTWETSVARAFLNNEFYNNAFSAEEKARILTTHVHTIDNEEFGTTGGNDTDDKVYLLSLDEVRRFYGIDSMEENFFSNLFARATEYTMSKGVWLEIEGSDKCWWWLRSSGGSLTRAGEVGSLGYLSYNGSEAFQTERAYRPIIWVLPE